MWRSFSNPILNPLINLDSNLRHYWKMLPFAVPHLGQDRIRIIKPARTFLVLAEIRTRLGYYRVVVIAGHCQPTAWPISTQQRQGLL
ncbi:unnamed protein product [Nezara viridula]|uniref:Uncharacterized protein n=1 Tax=Nezara viridula TaxID=85310 RepID=A0A9P0MX74_NEZVI|nr:unnamed protein product [Nezara viridula]